MVKLKDGTRTCSCRIQMGGQGLEPDYRGERLYLLDAQERRVGTIAYIRGLENHPLRGTEPDIQEAINLIRRTNTRRPPDRMMSSDESGGEAEADVESNDSGSFHGLSTASSEEAEGETQAEEDGNNEGAEQGAQGPEIAEEDRDDYEWILAIIQGRIPPPEPPTRRQSSTRDDLLDEDTAAPGTSTRNQAGTENHAR